MARISAISLACATAVFVLSANAGNALEVYHCEQLRGQTAWVSDESTKWLDDFYGPSTIIIDGDRFVIAGEEAPAGNALSVGDRIIYEVSVTSRDADHVIGVVARQGGINAFQFHRPSKTLVNVATRIDNFALPGNSMRQGNALAFVAKCR